MSESLNKQFQELQKEYLFSLDEDIDTVEELIVKKEFDQSHVKEIFRVVHSIKGGASSYELNIIGTICHNFEDYITTHYVKDKLEIDLEVIVDMSLKYVDLIKKAISAYKKDQESTPNECLEDLATLNTSTDEQKAVAYKGRILVAESTTTMANILKKSLSQSGYICVVSKNGLQAFNRLVGEKFDCLITSMNLTQLDGISLITALKSTNNINANIPTIVISASKNILERFPKDYKPSFVVEKDTKLVDNLTKSLESAFHPEVNNNSTEGPSKILYVEDDPRMQKLFQLAMKNHKNVEVQIASNREEANIKCREFKPDILLLDNFLKDATGLDVFNDVLDQKIPAVFLTASEASVDVAALKKHREFLGIITKPFRPGAIYGQICRFFSN